MKSGYFGPWERGLESCGACSCVECVLFWLFWLLGDGYMLDGKNVCVCSRQRKLIGGGHRLNLLLCLSAFQSPCAPDISN
jgi:hypothetical protein